MNDKPKPYNELLVATRNEGGCVVLGFLGECSLDDVAAKPVGGEGGLGWEERAEIPVSLDRE